MYTFETETTPELVEFYLIRHIEAEINKERHLIGGRSPGSPPTPLGIHQGEQLGYDLRERRLFPDAVRTSPTLRTHETARLSLQAMGVTLPIVEAEELHELSQGPNDGRPCREVYTPGVRMRHLFQGKNFKIEGGESINEVGLRMHNWMLRTAVEVSNQGGRRVFAYTHRGPIKYLAARLCDWSYIRTEHFTAVGNATLSLFTVQDGECRLIYLNGDA